MTLFNPILLVVVFELLFQLRFDEFLMLVHMGKRNLIFLDGFQSLCNLSFGLCICRNLCISQFSSMWFVIQKGSFAKKQHLIASLHQKTHNNLRILTLTAEYNLKTILGGA